MNRRLATSGGFASRSVVSLVIQVAFAALTMANTVLITRVLDTDQYGTFALGLSIISVIAIPSSFGLPNLVVREVSTAMARSDWAAAHGIMTWSRRVVLGIATATVALLVMITALFVERAELRATLLVGSLLILLLPSLRVQGGALRGFNHVLLGQTPDKLVYPALVTIAVVVYHLWSPDDATPALIIGIYVASAAVTVLISAAVLGRLIPPLVKSSAPVFHGAAWRASCIPLAATSGMLVINRYTDVLMIGFLREPADVGIYRVAAQFSLVVSFGLNAVNLVVAPRLARLFTENRLTDLQRLVVRASQAAAAFTVPVAIGFALFGRSVLDVFFRDDFAASFAPAMILIAGQVFNSLTGPVATLLTMTGRERQVMSGVAVSSLLNVVLNASLVPRFGIAAAAVSTAVSLAVWNIMLWRKVTKELGINCSVVPVRRPKNL